MGLPVLQFFYINLYKFTPYQINKNMRKLFFLLLGLPVLISACRHEESRRSSFLLPQEGSLVKKGEQVQLRLDFGKQLPDSVKYYIDSAQIAVKSDTTAASLKTSPLSFGSKLLTAKVYKGGIEEEISTNIIVIPAAAPKKYNYEIVNIFPHDTSSYTQGLEFHDGVLYESDGEYGGSSLRKVEVKTGNVIKKTDMPDKIFAEGISLVGSKLIMLTWQNGIGMVFDKNSFEKIGEFPYQASREGWGLCFDGTKLYKSDGTSRIYFLNKDTYEETGFIDVYDNKGAVEWINELEYIDGKIYANIYEANKVIVFDPNTGAVEGEIDFAGLLSKIDKYPNTNVLNGIAWNNISRTLFVTGKKWNKMFEVRIVPETAVP